MQLHFCGRLDDIAHQETEHLEVHPEYPDCMVGRVKWSKNIYEERDSPKQIMMGARNTYYCIILGLALFFDAWWKDERQQAKHIFNIRDTTKRTKDAVFHHIKNEWESGAVNIVKEGKFGTHSNRKRAYTKMRRSGISRDWADIRGRWKSRKTASDRYQDTSLPYPDAKAASALCDGGPIKYVVRDGFNISDHWIDEHVTCNMQKNRALDM